MTVFIAHAEADRAAAEALEKFLERRGQFVELENGERGFRHVQHADTVVALWSKDSIFSPYRLLLEKRTLEAWADEQLVMVKLDHAFSPVGLRDLAAIDASFEAQRDIAWSAVAKVAQEARLRPAPAAAPAPARARQAQSQDQSGGGPLDSVEEGAGGAPSPLDDIPGFVKPKKKSSGWFGVFMLLLVALVGGAASYTLFEMDRTDRAAIQLLAVESKSRQETLEGQVAAARAAVTKADADLAALGPAPQIVVGVRLPETEVRAREAANAEVTRAGHALTEINEKFERAQFDATEQAARAAEFDARGAFGLGQRFLMALGGSLLAFLLAALLFLPRRGKAIAVDAPDVAAGDPLFVSYSHADNTAVLPVVEAVQAQGRSVWIDKQGIGGGDGWAGEIVRAIKGAKGVIVMCSKQAFESDHVKREVYLADRYKKPMVPVFLESAPPPEDFEYFFAGVQWLELHKTPQADRAAAIARALKAV